MRGLRVIKNGKEIKFEGGMGEDRIKKMFPETITHKVFKTKSSFHVKEQTTGKV